MQVSSTRSVDRSAAAATPAGELGRQLFRLVPVQRALARAADPALGAQGFTVLGAIASTGPLRATELAEVLQVDLSVVSRQVTSLVEHGFVERRRDDDDRRAQLLVATARGREALRGSYEQIVARIERATASWEPGELRDLAAALERLIEDAR